MPKRTCTMPDCDRKHYCRGMCRRHHARWAREITKAAIGRPCAIDGCESAGTAGHGYCEKHYRRYQRHGSPHATSRIVGDDVARFWSYVDKSGPGGCWTWTGGKSPDGYGILHINNTTAYMPRFAYELMVAPIPDGLEPDHLCRNRACVNPAHLEPVTHRVNLLRGNAPSARNARKTRCIRGHEFTPENTYVTPSTGGRSCRECIKIHEGRRRERARALRAESAQCVA